MDLITSTRPFVVLTASCGGADYARTEHPVYQISVPHEFLAEPDKGAVVWIGPTAGSWQNGNEVIARAIIGELFENPQRPMGESYTNAIRSVLLQYVDVPDIVQTARSFQFLGDPMLPFMFVVTSAETKKDHRQPSALCLYHCRPNPFNPSTMILFDLPAQVL
jgi:hypothetical protein